MKRFLTGVFIMLLMSTLSFAQEEVVINSITISPSETTVTVGVTLHFIAVTYDTEGNEVEAVITWSVGGDIGEINADGEFTALLAGSGTVVASFGEITAQAVVTVNEVVVDEPVVASITISPTEATVVVGEEIKFTAAAYDAEENEVEAEITWSVEGEIGEIKEDGEFTALLAGSGTVVASVGEVTAQAVVTVNESEGEEEPELQPIEIFPDEAKVVIDETVQFEVTVKDAEGVEIEDAVVEWSLSNPDIGTIDENGLFTAVAEGATQVIATYGELFDEAEVEVTAEEQPPSTDANSVSIYRQLPNGNLVKFGSKKYEGDKITIGGLPHPFNYLNGTKILLTENCLSVDITITIKIPDFANIDETTDDVSFEGDILTAITFEVTVDGEVVSPFYFDEPVELTVPFKLGLLNNLGIDPEDLGLFFVTDTGELDGSGIDDVVVDPEADDITGDVEHFSDIAVAPKSAVPTLVEDDTIPEGFALSQNYPNPFNPETVIPYRITETANVKITIYNVVGQHVKTLVNELTLSGSYSVTWNGTDEAGRQLNSGLYFYRIQAGTSTQTRKLMLMK
ncbi:MAG TPA: T9SS type A sorting domain-containing protein [bacterium]|nr:T9SS type A sorting domain-containing protein [bacterium]